jgi:hypothetical protein
MCSSKLNFLFFPLLVIVLKLKNYGFLLSLEVEIASGPSLEALVALQLTTYPTHECHLSIIGYWANHHFSPWKSNSLSY